MDKGETAELNFQQRHGELLRAAQILESEAWALTDSPAAATYVCGLARERLVKLSRGNPPCHQGETAAEEDLLRRVLVRVAFPQGKEA